jgi:hypothetical protein
VSGIEAALLAGQLQVAEPPLCARWPEVSLQLAVDAGQLPRMRLLGWAGAMLVILADSEARRWSMVTVRPPGQIGAGTVLGGTGGGGALAWWWQGYMVPRGHPALEPEVAVYLAGLGSAGLLWLARVVNRRRAPGLAPVTPREGPS